jgi:hypothetical protein
MMARYEWEHFQKGAKEERDKMRAIIFACAVTLLFTTFAQTQTRVPGGYVRTQGGFMVPVPGSPQGSPYVANPPSYPYVRPAPGYPNINAPSLRQQYYMYGYPPRGR